MTGTRTYLVPLDPNAVIDRVRATTDPDWRSWRDARDRSEGRPFLASVGYRRFRVRPRQARRSWHPWMLPALVGRIDEWRDGSRITVRLERQSVVAWLPIVGMTLCVAALGIVTHRGDPAELLLVAAGVDALVLGKAEWDRRGERPDEAALLAWADAAFGN
jgi:hypothetical protein